MTAELREEIFKKLPNFIKLPPKLVESFVEKFLEKNVVPDKVSVFDRMISEEMTILATVKLDESNKTEYYSFTYNYFTKTVSSNSTIK